MVENQEYVQNKLCVVVQGVKLQYPILSILGINNNSNNNENELKKMENIKLFFCVSIMCLLLIACSSENDPSQGNIKKKSQIKVNHKQTELIKNSKTLTELFEFTHKVKLETNDLSILGKIDDIRIIDEKYILIIDYRYHDLTLFDLNGFFISKIGKKGLGPEEYNFLKSVDYIDSHFYVAGSNGKVLVYDVNGKYIKYYNVINNIGLVYLHKFYVENSNFLIYQNYPSSFKESVLKYDFKNGELLKKYQFEFNNYGYSPNLLSRLNSNEYLTSSSFSDEVYKINTKTNSISTFIKLSNTTKLPGTFKKITNQNEKVIWMVTNKKEVESFHPIHDIFCLEDYIIVSQIFFDRGGIKYNIFDMNGNLINIVNDYNFIENNKKLNFIEEFAPMFYKKGMIVEGIEEGEENLNPTLAFYKLKEH